MRKRLFGLFLLASLCLTPGLTPRSRAEIGVIDNVPAATLLLPYFEVDLNDVNGITTLFWVNNASASAALAHVTLWSDLGIPTLAFDIYLTGYDVQAINLRDVFDGRLPVTASVGQDQTDTISPHGVISQDINFASCNGTFPFVQPELRAQEIAALRNAHTGLASALTNNQCAGRNFGDNIARGYVTVDDVVACTGLLTGVYPGSPGYFTPFNPIGNRNLLWGDYFFVNPGENFAQGESLVHIEAAPGHFAPSDYTFYGRFSAVSGKDDREPLATNWAAPYDVGGSSGSGTDLLVWRDPTTPVSPFSCGSLPSPFPLDQTEIVVFDTEENPTVFTPTAGNEPFPWAVTRTSLGSGATPLPVTPRSGWVRLNLNTTVAGSPLPAGISQSHVTVIRDSQGRFSGGHVGIQLDNASNPNTTPIQP